MVERIRALIQAKQLSTTQFADAIGVARPVVSHILSGRNKPSLEVFQKILTAFSDLSTEWLLHGTGTMRSAGPALAATASLTASAAQVPPATAPAEVPVPSPAAPPAIAVSNPVSRPAAPAMPKPSRNATNSAPREPNLFADNLDGQSFRPVNPVGVPVVPSVANAPLSATPDAGSEAAATPEAVVAGLGVGKAIRRIVIFYRDGSFADYQPE